MTLYNIKAIPTVYNHVQFRSRLEARWAAFFDLCGWQWDYEPFDLDGWAPDFKIVSGSVAALAEVKPLDATCQDVSVYADVFKKAAAHSDKYKVLLLCDGPVNALAGVPLCEECDLDEFADAIRHPDIDATWREAGNVVQWNSPKNEHDDYHTQLRRIFKKRAA
ncbi:hypothetical protein EHS39_11620 [Ensifer sp. MPMI2T]|nr:hypothetical protein EHS39_11620 [Ensifer sp. MPMI2T]